MPTSLMQLRTHDLKGLQKLRKNQQQWEYRNTGRTVLPASCVLSSTLDRDPGVIVDRRVKITQQSVWKVFP